MYINRLKSLREDNDLLQKQISAILKTTQQQYSKYEKGQQALPIEHLITLAKFYNVSTDYILNLTNETKPYPNSKSKE